MEPRLEGQLARDQRRSELSICGSYISMAVLVTDGEHVGETGGGMIRAVVAPLRIDQGVGDDGGGVHHQAADLGRARPGLAEHLIDPGEEAPEQVIVSGQHLVDGEGPIVRAKHHVE